jgi:hypothetical protein
MTETDWLTCKDPQLMLTFLKGNGSSRKLRLFAISCCRRWTSLLVPETLGALEIAELFAEGQVDSFARKQAREIALHAPWCSDKSTAHRRGPAKACVAAALARRSHEAAASAEHFGRNIGVLSRKWDRDAYEQTELGLKIKPHEWTKARLEQAEYHATVIKDIFGNPFLPVALDHSWLTSTILSLARQMYESRDFSLMPILADALQDAGCDREDVLNHCRGPGPHVRGCFVVDLVLSQK